MLSLKRLFSPVKSLSPQQANDFMGGHEEGTFTVLDVRQPAEYEEAHIPGAKLIPLPKLHDSADQLDRETPIITYCAVGGRSRVASQLLSGMGFKEVYNLKGGIQAWNGQKVTGPVELNLELVRGDESPTEMVVIAYQMESALQMFYSTLIEGTNDKDLKALLDELASMEEGHKRILEGLGSVLDPPVKALETMEQRGPGKKVMEGGYDVVAFMGQNRAYLNTVRSMMELAMMLEAQALDLYLRFAQKSSHEGAKAVLFRISDEEKTHLKELGARLERSL
jgi:rhodanese-related sulfurtransferase/rubrerythrin